MFLLHWLIYRTKALRGGKSFTVTAQLQKPSQSIMVIITPVSPRLDYSVIILKNIL